MRTRFLPACFRRSVLRSAAVLTLAALTPALHAWPWKAQPQPLLERKEAILSDADSPLAWDNSARTLWYLAGGNLAGAYWSGNTFHHGAGGLAPVAKAGLLADAGLHFVYFVDAAGSPNVVHLRAPWRVEKIAGATVTRLLAVDSRRHAFFAYDAGARGIRAFTYDATAAAWTAELIATGLGAAEEAGAYDALSRVLYTSHETADAAIPRHAAVTTVADPTGFGAWPPWPLVATTWSGSGWTSRVLDETGVPQQPAVRLTDHRVFYAQRDESELVHYYQPARGKLPEAFGSVAGWSGSDTYEDNNSYTIRKPDYPSWWPTTGSGSITVIGHPPVIYHAPEVTLQGPIAVVPYYEPIWTDTALPPRLVRFRAVINARQTRLVQHRLVASGETVRQQTGQRLAGYLYRDAKGVVAKRGASTPNLWSPTSATVNFPALDATFDPAHPPASFQSLASANAAFTAYFSDTLGTTSLRLSSGSIEVNFADANYFSISSTASLDAQAPWVAPYLRPPSLVRSRNFGHNYGSRALEQTGGRYRSFYDASTSLAASSQLATDPGSGATFYTQAPAPRVDSYQTLNFFPNPLAGFSRVVERKFTPTLQSVWIVYVY